MAGTSNVERTDELGSEGGSHGELAQTVRAATGENAAGLKAGSSPGFSLAIVATAVLVLLLFVWFGSSLTELLTAQP
ncbi:MAG: hypothetical protein AB7P22_11430 [Vicinamibacterales bacterium]